MIDGLMLYSALKTVGYFRGAGLDWADIDIGSRYGVEVRKRNILLEL
jgi:hypothetical protein